MLPRPTEASRRFERGLPPESAMSGALRAAQLMVELAGAQIVGAPVDTYPAPLERTPIVLHQTELHRLLGVSFEPAEVARVGARGVDPLAVALHEAVHGDEVVLADDGDALAGGAGEGAAARLLAGLEQHPHRNGRRERFIWWMVGTRTFSSTRSKSLSVTSGVGQYAPMPPVLGPVSPSWARL